MIEIQHCQEQEKVEEEERELMRILKDKQVSNNIMRAPVSNDYHHYM